jgi:hypothetical protein
MAPNSAPEWIRTLDQWIGNAEGTRGVVSRTRRERFRISASGVNAWVTRERRFHAAATLGLQSFGPLPRNALHTATTRSRSASSVKYRW